MSRLRLSHILQRVTDLPAAVADAEAAGFTVHWGSDPDHAHNALVWFEDGPFLELFAVPPFDESLAEVYVQHAGPGSVLRSRRWATMDDGWCDYALETDDDDLGEVMDRCSANGMAIGPKFRPNRALPGGGAVEWDLAFPHAGDLPFVMGAYAPAQRPTTVTHANGATAITSISVAHADPERHVAELARYADTDTLAGVEIIAGGRDDDVVITAVHAAGLAAPVAFGSGTITPA
ncbi:MAG: VOC family protein [Actinomycetota bacterium]